MKLIPEENRSSREFLEKHYHLLPFCHQTQFGVQSCICKEKTLPTPRTGRNRRAICCYPLAVGICTHCRHSGTDCRNLGWGLPQRLPQTTQSQHKNTGAYRPDTPGQRSGYVYFGYSYLKPWKKQTVSSKLKLCSRGHPSFM